jgi:MFS family permease
MTDNEIGEWLARRWRPLVLVCWLATAVFLLQDRWSMVQEFVLQDTDDNMRIMQVRAWMAGQGWFDLRQYRLDPPFGANIHWSRLVDLPIAAIITILRPVIGGAMAEKWAVAIAPMLPMAVGMTAIALAARRLVDPKAYLLAIGLLLCAHSTRFMWSPMRIDHHGWQLAFLALVMASLADRDKIRGGITMGLATAASLTIGLELMIELAIAGAIVVLMWIHNRDQAPRMAAFGITLAAGSAFGFLVFASYANRAPVCDALSPVWLSAMTLGGALCLVLAWTNPVRWPVRMGIAAASGLLLAAAFALTWPHCLGRLEGVPPELERLWLDNVREARPIYRQSLPVIVAFLSLPLLSVFGYALMLYRHRRNPEMLTPWTALAALAIATALLLLWQTRVGAAAQLLAIPGVTALAWVVSVAALGSSRSYIRIFVPVAAFLIVSGLAGQFAFDKFYNEKTPTRTKATNQANRLCPTMAAMRPVALVPKGYVLTLIDLAPRLITVTHHDSVAGPYHRNATALLDVMHIFRGTPDYAHAMIARRHIDYVLICPDFSEATSYVAERPNGFFAQLAKGRIPDWLEPIPLGSKSPLKMWRVRPAPSNEA